MEPENTIWLVGLLALAAGISIGALAYRLFTTSVKEVDKIKAELNDARQELDQYKAGVTQHFDKTAELVNDLAQNYVKVYQHLAEGAQTLGASKSFKDLIEQHQGKTSIAVDDQPEVAEAADMQEAAVDISADSAVASVDISTDPPEPSEDSSESHKNKT